MSSTQKKQGENDTLHKALKETFPASDPVSANEVDKEGVRPAHRKTPIIDKDLVNDLAKEVEEKNRQ